MDPSRRELLRALAALAVEQFAATKLPASPAPSHLDRRVILVITGGVRFQETFSERGARNIPHLSQDLLPGSLFYSHVRNEGVTSHFNSISSILTGNWQRVDDWGNQPPRTPTLFEYARNQLHLPGDEVWMIASNKALSYQIGASDVKGYGVPYGANVVFPKVLLLTAVEEAIRKGHQSSMADREKVQRELEAVIQSSDYEGLGWEILGSTRRLDPLLEASVRNAIEKFIHTNAPATGDQLTFFVSAEIMRRYAPPVLVVNFSDVEAAHFGSYSIHLAGIRNTDRLIHELWQEVNENEHYRGRTLMVVVPEFGRDPDGSNTNGFLNHRSNSDSCRRIWMMCLGQHAAHAQVVDRPVRSVDICPTLARWLGCRAAESTGSLLNEIAG